ncbi:MAG: RluA family pseudouridine synthase [Clostridia bacterium]|jgi:23S rRNA pseudouridine1911/1915/1917 synthase|nr:RluA family pseudouridine synthase [Clostridia bacterium]
MIIKFELDETTRIDSFLSEKLAEMSRAGVQKLLKSGDILVNGNAVKANYKLKMNDEISISIPESKEVELVAENIPLDILFEDDDLLVVNKPKRMVVHPAAGHESGTLVNAIMYHCKEKLSGINGEIRPGIVHRIDKDTSGILVVAKNDFTHNHLSEQFKEHSILRRYHAICHNNIKEDKISISAPIGRNPNDRKKMAVNYHRGKEATTHVSVVERFGEYTYVTASLETGRTHQIRVHMADKKVPLIGDEVYGPKKKAPFKTNGQCLHAKILGFIHPRTEEFMKFEIDLPEYFIKILNKLRNDKGE